MSDIHKLRYRRDGLRPLNDTDMDRAVREELDELDDFSAGCVVFREDDNHVLMLQPKTSKTDKLFWVFPKGHPDDSDESIVAAATRETVEETGVKPSTVYDEDQIDVGYSFIKRLHKDKWLKHEFYPDESKRPILVTHKIVKYYLATATSEAARDISDGGTEEATAVKWIPTGEVLSNLEFEEEKKAFTHCLQCLRNKGQFAERSSMALNDRSRRDYGDITEGGGRT